MKSLCGGRALPSWRTVADGGISPLSQPAGAHLDSSALSSSLMMTSRVSPVRKTQTITGLSAVAAIIFLTLCVRNKTLILVFS